jgi:glycosyltransferase involved in cell wall biosynthesis
MKGIATNRDENNFQIFKSTIKTNHRLNLQENPKPIRKSASTNSIAKPEILFITSYPPRECGIATYSQDLRNAIDDKFGNSFQLKVCALESKECAFDYPEEVKYKLQTQNEDSYKELADKINKNSTIISVFLQHEFGLFGGDYGDKLIPFLKSLLVPVTTTLHTVLPNPDKKLLNVVHEISSNSEQIIVMTKNSAAILMDHYGIEEDKIEIIPHGTHLISQIEIDDVTLKNQFEGRIVLTTFGLVSEGKSIETALDALPEIIAKFPNILYLIIGKTHPEVVKKEGEKYRESLYEKVEKLHLQDNVLFVNKYLALPDLIKYLQHTTIYLFTAKDPNQAVSGTLAYAMSCGCPIISTPIPHAKELIDGAGLNFDFQDSSQLAKAAISLLYQPKLLKEMKLNALHKINPTSWQNSALAHIKSIENNVENRNLTLKYELPKISLDHIRRLTTVNGMIQFSQISTPDLETGYTLDDNARALIAVTKHYQVCNDVCNLNLISTYLNFILFCQQEDGKFLNYVDKYGNFTINNNNENLEDSNGRAIWALGEFCSHYDLFPSEYIEKARVAIQKALPHIILFKSPRAISFSIKGLYFYDKFNPKFGITQIITILADNLVSKYRGVSDKKWKWFENYLTYANSLLPEAMLYASLKTGSKLYKKIAKDSFDFLLDVIFKYDQIKVVSNQGWNHKGKDANNFGEQPIDVAYTILALNKFYEVFQEKDYYDKMVIAFDWFLGKNHLNQIVYNPKTGGCYDGLEENHINLNQGAESTVSYLMARSVFEKNPGSGVKLKF